MVLSGNISIENRTVMDEQNVTVSQVWWTLRGLGDHPVVQNKLNTDVVVVLYSNMIHKPISNAIPSLT